MTQDEAQITFAKYLNDPCPVCKKPVGKLCNTSAVWVHVERMQLFFDRQDAGDEAHER